MGEIKHIRKVLGEIKHFRKDLQEIDYTYAAGQLKKIEKTVEIIDAESEQRNKNIAKLIDEESEQRKKAKKTIR